MRGPGEGTRLGPELIDADLDGCVVAQTVIEHLYDKVVECPDLRVGVVPVLLEDERERPVLEPPDAANDAPRAVLAHIAVD